MRLIYISILIPAFIVSSIIFVNYQEVSASSIEIPDIQTNDDDIQNTSIIGNSTTPIDTVEEFALKATLEEEQSPIEALQALTRENLQALDGDDENPPLSDDVYYEIDGFGLNLSPNSTLCPTNNCEFELEDGKLNSVSTGQYVFTGVLKVGVEEEEGTRSNVMSMSSSLNVKETLENDDTTSEFLTGKFNLGETNTVLVSPEISYRVTNGSLVIEDDEATLILQGERNN